MRVVVTSHPRVDFSLPAMSLGHSMAMSLHGRTKEHHPHAASRHGCADVHPP